MPTREALGDEMSSTTTTTTTNDTDGGDAEAQREFIFKVVVIGPHGVGKTTLLHQILSLMCATSVESDEANTTPMENGIEDKKKKGEKTKEKETTPKNSICVTVTEEEKDVEETKEEEAVFGMPLAVLPTIGTDFFSCVVSHGESAVRLRLQFWDTAGLSHYSVASESTFRNAAAVMAVFDACDCRSVALLRQQQLETAMPHIKEIESMKLFIVANKMDALDNMTHHEKETMAVTQRDVLSKLLSLSSLAPIENIADVEVLYHEVSALSGDGVQKLFHRLCDSLLSRHDNSKNATQFFTNHRKGRFTTPTTLQNSLLPRDSLSTVLEKEETTYLQTETKRVGGEIEEYSPMETREKTDSVISEQESMILHLNATKMYVDPLQLQFLNIINCQNMDTATIGYTSGVNSKGTAPLEKNGVSEDRAKELEDMQSDSSIPMTYKTKLYENHIMQTTGLSEDADDVQSSKSCAGCAGEKSQYVGMCRSSLGSSAFKQLLETKCREKEEKAVNKILTEQQSASVLNVEKKEEKMEFSSCFCFCPFFKKSKRSGRQKT